MEAQRRKDSEDRKKHHTHNNDLSVGEMLKDEDKNRFFTCKDDGQEPGHDNNFISNLKEAIET